MWIVEPSARTEREWFPAQPRERLTGRCWRRECSVLARLGFVSSHLTRRLPVRTAVRRHLAAVVVAEDLAAAQTDSWRWEGVLADHLTMLVLEYREHSVPPVEVVRHWEERLVVAGPSRLVRRWE